ncbi:DNA gyrase inhibitor YacG [Humisphaera borealis]|uniref:DNA gyrase inhibitor YacG n=1 Tax=Humisphaera borealis TaxID=2807512 RepID=A0A7M2WPH1_9BACT|nr:DNA gyrase inhibitor YacG [Humisphaera borealis]QOV87427.1 DNA gyrase inhibitor YacG [Humisphaera borealis]
MASTACPICKKPVPIPRDDEPMGRFPFCSERCKLVDLGRWLDGKYQIPVAKDDDEEKDTPDFELEDD